ncbi:hypothetical protein R1flu_018571 [Riccia fluitans]|uniref:Uncharacterized protein n=1 Tax=Riccia fluitans TaxID=41844 RepID=A0ABD1ZG77_9MARC
MQLEELLNSEEEDYPEGGKGRLIPEVPKTSPKGEMPKERSKISTRPPLACLPLPAHKELTTKPSKEEKVKIPTGRGYITKGQENKDLTTEEFLFQGITNIDWMDVEELVAFNLNSSWAYNELLQRLIRIEVEFDALHKEAYSYIRKKIEELTDEVPVASLLARVTCLTEAAFATKWKTEQVKISLTKLKAKYLKLAKEHKKTKKTHETEVHRLKVGLAAKDDELQQAKLCGDLQQRLC